MARPQKSTRNVNAGDKVESRFNVEGAELVRVVSSVADADDAGDLGAVVVKPTAGIGTLDLPIAADDESAVIFEDGTAYKVGVYPVKAWEAVMVEVENAGSGSRDVTLQVFRG